MQNTLLYFLTLANFFNNWQFFNRRNIQITHTLKMQTAIIAVAIVAIILVIFYFKSRAIEGCCGNISHSIGSEYETNRSNEISLTEGFALDLSPRGGYPNCKGCVIEPPLEESSTAAQGLWDGSPGMGISTTMSGTVFRDWQTLHGNNMKGTHAPAFVHQPPFRPVHSNNISLELVEDKKMYDYLTNPFNYPRYAIAADPSLQPIKVSGCDYCHDSAHGCMKCRIHAGENKAVVGTGMSKDYYMMDMHGLF